MKHVLVLMRLHLVTMFLTGFPALNDMRAGVAIEGGL